MRKVYYIYNPKTRTYDRIYPTMRQRVMSYLRRLFVGMGLGAGSFIVLLLIFGSPSEKDLRMENSRLQAQYHILSSRLDESLQVMKGLQQRDDNLYRVMMQADAEDRVSPETLNRIMIRNGSDMAPISQYVTLRKVYGPDNIKRFNMFTAISVNGTPAAGYTSGQAIQAIEEVAAETLPTGYGYEYSGMTREEQSAGGSTTAIIFALCLVFVYLLLSAQYESYILPLSVILTIPFGLCGSFIFAQMMGVDNNIYLQIALIMLMGLLAKNAILIVEFALERRRTGMSIINAAVQGAISRLRPILMTSLAMIVGLLPLMFASGVGAVGNSTLGTGAVGGMLIGMICQVFITPVLFVVFETLQEKFKPMEWKDLDNSELTPEIEQYSK